MEWLWSSTRSALKVLWSYMVAFLRLLNWTIIFFFTGLQRTLFMRSEVVSVEFRVMPLRCDLEDTDDKLAYIDKLCLENPDLAVAVEDEDLSFLDDIDDLTSDEDDGDEGEP